MLNPNVVYSALASARDLEMRAKLRSEIRRKVSGIVFWFARDKRSPRLVEDPAQELFPFAEVQFTNGRKRYVLLLHDGAFMTLERRSNPA